MELHTKGIYSIELLNDEITYIRTNDDNELDLADCQFCYDFLKARLTLEHKLLLLIEISQFTAVTSDVIDYSKRIPSNTSTIACAVITNSLGTKMVLKYIANVVKGKGIEVKIFKSRTMAVNWLLSVK